MKSKLSIGNIRGLKGGHKITEEKDDSGTIHFLKGMDEITVKEAHFYTYKKSLVGFQFFYLHNDCSISNGLTSDLPDEYHDKLINLGCSEEDYIKFPTGFKQFELNIVLDKYQFSTKIDTFGEYSITITKSIFRPDLSEFEFIHQIFSDSPQISSNKNIKINDQFFYNLYLVSSKGYVYNIIHDDNSKEINQLSESMKGKYQICGLTAYYINYKPNKYIIRLFECLGLIRSLHPKLIADYQKKMNLEEEDLNLFDDDDYDIPDKKEKASVEDFYDGIGLFD